MMVLRGPGSCGQKNQVSAAWKVSKSRVILAGASLVLYDHASQDLYGRTWKSASFLSSPSSLNVAHDLAVA